MAEELGSHIVRSLEKAKEDLETAEGKKQVEKAADDLEAELDRLLELLKK
jgi:hypothetical protein